MSNQNPPILQPHEVVKAWVFSQNPDGSLSPASLGSGGSASSPAIVSNGLMAQYKILPTESPAALVDYSGNGNNATGTVGTVPTIVPGSGGVQFLGAGAISLPATLNSALTIQIFASYHVNDYAGQTPPTVQSLMSLIQGNDNTFVSGIGKICGITLRGGQGITNDNWGNKTAGGRQLRSLLAQNSNLYASSTLGIFEGVGSLALVQGATDSFYINGVAQRNFLSASSAGLQTAGNYQLGGCAQGAGLQNFPTYMVGTIYYAIFYNRALSATEIAQNHQAITAELASRGVYSQNSGPLINTGLTNSAGVQDVHPQVVFRGDSITAGANAPFWFDNLTPAGVGGQLLQLSNQGLSGDSLVSIQSPFTPMETDSLYRRGGSANLIYNFLGVNDTLSALFRLGAVRNFCAERKQLGWKTIVGTITSNGNETLSGGSNAFNETIRNTYKTFADGICDWSSCPNLGAFGSSLSTNYFTGGLHPTGLGNKSIIAPLVTRTTDRQYGNNDWSSAFTASVNTGPAFVQGFLFGGTAGNFIQNTLKIDNLPGSTLFLATDGYNGFGFSVTDSNNNNWQLLISQGNNGIWFAQNVKGGLNTIALNFGGNSFLRGSIAEFSGVSRTVAPITVNGAGTGTALTSGNITTVTNGSLIVGAALNSGAIRTYTPGASFIQDVLPTGASTNTNYFEHLVQGVAGAIAATATIGSSATWNMAAIGLAPDNGATYPMQNRDVFLKADPTNGSLTILLYPAVGLTGQRIKIKNIQTSGANTVTIKPVALGITSVVANGTTAVFTVPDVTPFISGQTIITQGCTTAGLNATSTITSTTVIGSGPSGTITVPSAVTVTESEPATASIGCEFIDGATSVVLANNTTLVLESIINNNTAVRGCNWTSVTD